MISLIKKNIFDHALFWMNIAVFIILLYGLALSFGFQYFDELTFYVVPFAISYYFLHRSKKTINESDFSFIRNEKTLKILVDLMILFAIVFQVIHYILLKHIPIVTAAISTDYYGIAYIRQNIKELDSVFISYGSAFLLKSILPFGIFMLFSYDKKRFWFFTFVSIFYAVALMQKAFIISIFIPLMMSLLLDRKWIKSILFLIVSFIGIVFIVLVTNPELRPINAAERPAKSRFKSVPSGEIASGIGDRIFKLTGKMVGNWFKYIPDTMAFQYGNSYRLVAKVTGKPYVDFSREIYKKTYVKETKMGFEGTATSAFFMYDYSNFGKFGLCIGGVLLALIFKFINKIFGDDVKSKIALNSLSILWLSSAALSTTLLSGGWALTIVLYFIFKPIIFKPQL
jgi:hypothetical protein